MNRVLLSSLVTGLLITFLTTSTAQDKNPAGGTDTERPKESEGARAVYNLSMANDLIDYGIANKSPTALLAAAEIIHNNDVKNDPKADIVFKEEGYEKPKSDGQSRTPKILLELARATARDLNTTEYDAAIEATAKKLAEKSRSPSNGIFVRQGHLHGGGRATYWVHCHGHTHANVYPHFPNANEDMDIFVYNQSGQLIEFDRSPRSSASVHWNGNGDFRIVVQMYSPGHCDYTLRVS